MANKIPEETIEQIRNSVDIVDVVGEYVHLKKQGRNFMGLCPFHDERTPSFSVSPDKQIYHCFGCGNGGNVFTFLMEIDGLGFVEAVKKLADQANIGLPNVTVDDGRQIASSDRRKLAEIHEWLVKFYQSCLLRTQSGEKARHYLQQRGFSDETIERFQIGYAPEEWELAAHFLEKRHFSPEILEKSGLFSKRAFDGKIFDRFRDRIMFPIWDSRGQAIAFGGRVITDAQPKYLNSPETEVFRKGKTLYAFHLAKRSIREAKQAVVMEGYVDVVSAHQAGVTQAVASLGTSFTNEQAHLLKRHADSVVICYDADRAGIDGALRAAELLQQSGLYVKIASIPGGLDPDDYIRKFGGSRFQTEVIGASQTVTAFKIHHMRKGKNLNDEGDQLRYIEEVLRVIAALPKAVERDHYLRQLSEEFSLSLDALKQQQYAIYRQLKKSGMKAEANRNVNMRGHVRKQTLLPAPLKAERMLLAYMIQDEEIAQRVQEELAGAFHVEEHEAVAAHLFAYYADGNPPDIGAFIDQLGNEKLVRMVTELAVTPLNEPANEQEINDYIQQVRTYPKRLEIEEMKRQRKAAESAGDSDEAARIAMKILHIKREIKGMYL
ncbi:MAG TPA: DNA primase [Bacillales bacterium]|nr:DNA primase [Bacillales bacterium]